MASTSTYLAGPVKKHVDWTTGTCWGMAAPDGIFV